MASGLLRGSILAKYNKTHCKFDIPIWRQWLRANHSVCPVTRYIAAFSILNAEKEKRKKMVKHYRFDIKFHSRGLNNNFFQIPSEWCA